MASKAKTPTIVIIIPIVFFIILGVILYKNFFKKIDLVDVPIPKAEIIRISPPEDLPEFRALNEKHQFINIKKFKGKILLINFWATWCLPCVKELPQLEELLQVFGSDNIAIIPISIDSDKTVKKLQSFFKDLGLKNLSVYQDKNLEAYEAIRALGVPTTIIVDRNLKVHLKVSGYLNWKDPQIMTLLSRLP